MATEIWVNIGSGNAVLPDGTKPLPEPVALLAVRLMAISFKTKFTSKVTCLYVSNRKRASDLTIILKYMQAPNDELTMNSTLKHTY